MTEEKAIESETKLESIVDNILQKAGGPCSQIWIEECKNKCSGIGLGCFFNCQRAYSGLPPINLPY